MQALRYNTTVDAEGRFSLPPLASLAGASIEVLVLVPDWPDDANEFDGLAAAAVSTMDFWDNPIDDEVWNNA